jgi:hypothetical protein
MPLVTNNFLVFFAVILSVQHVIEEAGSTIPLSVQQFAQFLAKRVHHIPRLSLPFIFSPSPASLSFSVYTSDRKSGRAE